MGHLEEAVAAWASFARSNEFWQAQAPQSLISIVSRLLTGLEPRTAAADATALFSNRMNGSGETGVIWSVICSAIRSLGSTAPASDRIIAFVKEISKNVQLDDDGVPLQSPWNDQLSGSGYPSFGQSFLDDAIHIQYEEDCPGGFPEWLNQADSYRNACATAALILQDQDQFHHMQNALLASLGDTFEQALEVSLENDRPRQKASLWVPAASCWIQSGGEYIKKLCEDRKSSPFGDWVPAPDFDGHEWLWGKGRDFSPERWDFWRQRFSTIANMSNIDKEVAEYAALAAGKMK